MPAERQEPQRLNLVAGSAGQAGRKRGGKNMGRLIGVVLLILVTVAPTCAQDVAAAEQRIEGLRAQLREVADREARVQERVRQIEEDLRPENVERSVAAVGTTDARALREQRREQLEREKASVEGQLRSLATSRTNLEATIASAEAEAVRIRASNLGASNAPPRTETHGTAATPTAQKSTRRAGKRPARRGPRRRRAPAPR